MPRSKRIEDYFSVEVNRLRLEAELPVPLHLYFPSNQHIITWRAQAEWISSEFLENCRKKGLLQLWIHNDDRAEFERYLNPQEVARSAELEAATESGKKIGQEIAEKLNDAELPEEKKKEEIQSLAQQLLARAGQASDAVGQRKANREMSAAVAEMLNRVWGDIFDETRSAAKKQFDEIWQLANIDPDFEHGLNVSTFAVIFAMAFGRIERSLLADLAYAGLIHDIGMCQTPVEVTDKPWKSFSTDDVAVYSAHVDAGLAIVNFFATPQRSAEGDSTPEAAEEDPSKVIVPERVKSIMSQHHEKFDGSGYPRAYRGFQVDDISQLLAIADILDSFASGQWDGQTRTLAQTFELLEGLEKARTFPEYFNPDVFAAVVQWIRSAAASQARENAVEIAQTEARKLVGAN